MNSEPSQAYHSRETLLLVIYDLRGPGVAERLHRERAAWQECSEIEALDEDHFILIVRPGTPVWEAA